MTIRIILPARDFLFMTITSIPCIQEYLFMTKCKVLFVQYHLFMTLLACLSTLPSLWQPDQHCTEAAGVLRPDPACPSDAEP